jgi:hypothetical protein
MSYIAQGVSSPSNFILIRAGETQAQAGYVNLVQYLCKLLGVSL